ncbi:MAG: Holliday junction branch migration protein RuvA [Bacillota bacterium]|jgi:Holliday junction DNA helicase RuvA
MIAFLRGKIFDIEEDSLVIEKSGIGITVLAPLAQFGHQLSVGDEIFLHTHLHIREESWLLFGFSQKEQLEIFRYLIAVSGIGPKTALVILNTLSATSIISNINKADPTVFYSVPGIGKKTAQRLVLELKDKFAKWDITADDDIAEMPQLVSQESSDLLAALSQLGYNITESRSLAAKAIEKLGEEATVNDLIKEALRLTAKL